MPKPKSRFCTECPKPSGTDDDRYVRHPQMKRLYERQGTAFVPAGWICPVCQYMTRDEKEKREEGLAKEIPKLVEMGEPEGTNEICLECKAWATCTAVTPGTPRCKKTRAKIEEDLHNQDTLPVSQVPGPAQLQAAFDRAGINAVVVERPSGKLTLAYCRSKMCTDLEQRTPENGGGKGWQCALTGNLPGGGGMGRSECKYCQA